MYQYAVNLSRVVDADTLDVDVDLGFHIWLKGQRIRLDGVNTPELRPREGNDVQKAAEKHFGQAAKVFVESWLAARTQIVCSTLDGEDRIAPEEGKFGRWLAWVHDADGMASLNQALVDAEFARWYDGGRRDAWFSPEAAALYMETV